MFKSDGTEPVAPEDNMADIHLSTSKHRPRASSPLQNNQEEEYHPHMPTDIPDNGFAELVETMQDGFLQVKDLLFDLLHMHRRTNNEAALPSELTSSASDTASTPQAFQVSRHLVNKGQLFMPMYYVLQCVYHGYCTSYSKKYGRFLKPCWTKTVTLKDGMCLQGML